MLRIQHIVHRVHEPVLVHNARAWPTQLNHLSTHAQQQANVNAHRTDVRARLACDPEDAQTILFEII